jgi:hypothetical protein
MGSVNKNHLKIYGNQGAGRGAERALAASPPLRKQITWREVRRNFFLSAAENLFSNAQQPCSKNVWLRA